MHVVRHACEGRQQDDSVEQGSSFVLRMHLWRLPVVSRDKRERGA
jgi:hypothetical protein